MFHRAQVLAAKRRLPNVISTGSARAAENALKAIAALHKTLRGSNYTIYLQACKLRSKAMWLSQLISETDENSVNAVAALHGLIVRETAHLHGKNPHAKHTHLTKASNDRQR